MTKSTSKIKRKSAKKSNFLKTKPTKACIKNNILDDKIIIKGRIGADSVYGEAYSGCYPLSCKYSIAIKKIPLTARDYSYQDFSDDKRVLNTSESWSEIYFLKLVGALKEQNIIPHVPSYYKYYICDNCEYLNKAISKNIRDQGKCIILPNDLADGDLKYFINNSVKSEKSLFLAYFQIFMGIYAIQHYFNIHHNDLHYGNVLFKKVEKGYNKYTIDKTHYYVPNNGLLFYLWDFGLATIPGIIEPRRSSSPSSIEEDYKRVAAMIIPDDETTDYALKAKEIYRVFKSMIKTFSDKKILIKYYLSFVSEPYFQDMNIVGEYSLDKKLSKIGLTIYK